MATMTRRAVVGSVLIVLAAATALVTVRARRLAIRVDAIAVEHERTSSSRNPLRDFHPVAPFRVAVVGPARGDHAALGRAVDEIVRRGPIHFAVLLGDVLRAGGDPE